MTSFRRDRLTLTLYGSFVMWGWFLYSFSPSVPLLAADLGVSRALAGLHGTALAVGAVVAAVLNPPFVRRAGRRVAVVVGVLLVAVGVTALLLGPSLSWTLGAMVLLAVGGNVAVSGVQVALALHHRDAASAAITEANGAGSTVGLLGPLAVGLAVGLGWGWRPAVAVTVVLAVLVALATARVRLPARHTEVVEPGERPGRGDPARVRPQALAAAGFLGSVVAGIALENVTTYWSAELVVTRTGAPASIATATTAGLVAGMSIVRFALAPLSLRIRPVHLLTASYGLAVVGWALLWSTTVPAVALAGLFLAGLGYGAQYPLSIALLLRASGTAVDTAQSRATFVGGLAVGAAPFGLGALADAVGPHRAFLLVPAIAVLGAVCAHLGGRSLTAGERA